MSIESVTPSNHLILCQPLLLLPSIFPSIRVFSNESALLIKWPKYWNDGFIFNCTHAFSLIWAPPSTHAQLSVSLCNRILPAAYEGIFHYMIAHWSADIWLNRNLSTYPSQHIQHWIQTISSKRAFLPSVLSSGTPSLSVRSLKFRILAGLSISPLQPPLPPTGHQEASPACRLLPIHSLVLWFSGHRPGLAFLSPTESPYFNPSRPPLLLLSTFIFICTSSHRWPSPGRGCEAKSEWHRM